MFLNQKYRNRHKILDVLQKKQLAGMSPSNIDASEIELAFGEIAKLGNLTEQEVLEQIDYLLLQEEIYVSERDFSTYYLILQKGTTSYYDKKYIYNGKKEFKNDIYDTVKTISAILLLFIAIISFVMNIIDTKNNKKDIEKIKAEIKRIGEFPQNKK